MTGTSSTLDLDRLSARATRAAQAWRAGCQVIDIVPLEGGQSSLTFLARAAPHTELIVLKVAPPGLEPLRNRDVLRQARLLSALAAVPLMKVPRVLFTVSAGSLDEPPFFAMSHVPGTSFEPHLSPELDGSSNEEIAGRAHHAARLLALLHRQRAEDLRVEHEPIVSLAGEVTRWERALATVPDVDRDRARSAIEGLRAAVPDDEPACVLHGDFRLGNMLSDHDTVNAVIDWEIWSRGDPRIDLAWFLLCADAGAHPTAVRAHPGMPGHDALVRQYVAAGGRPPSHLGWFRALALTKMAATTALIAKHHRRAAQLELADRTAASVTPMLDRAIAAL